MQRCVLPLTAIDVTLAAATAAPAAERIRLAVQNRNARRGNSDVIKTHGLDRKHGPQIEATIAAARSPKPARSRSGGFPLISCSPIGLRVARERSLGDNVVLPSPPSSTLGAVMACRPCAHPRRRRPEGQEARVAGGPLDSRAGLPQALARRSGIDLRRQATIVYGAPPLLAEKALQGEIDATLTFWNFCAELEGKGFKRAVGVDQVMKGLGAKGPIAIVGYTFDGAWAARNRAAVDRFLAAAREAKGILASSEAEWQRLAPRIRVTDSETLAIYRQRYSEGIVRRPLDEEEADARALYRALADVAGTELVGPARELARAPSTGRRRIARGGNLGARTVSLAC